MKALVFVVLLVLASEYCKSVAHWALIENNKQGVNMKEKIYKIVCGVCDALVAFTISIAAGTLLFPSKFIN